MFGSLGLMMTFVDSIIILRFHELNTAILLDFWDLHFWTIWTIRSSTFLPFFVGHEEVPKAAALKVNMIQIIEWFVTMLYFVNFYNLLSFFTCFVTLILFYFRVDNLLCILITDRDGVPILKGMLILSYLFSQLITYLLI